MTAEEKKAFAALEDRLTKTEKQLAEAQTEITKLKKGVPAPVWFVKEFGSADLGGLVNEPQFTEEGWRVMAIGLRALGERRYFA